MAHLLQHQNSNGLHDKNHTGCMGGLLRYFDYHQLLPGDAKQAGSTEHSRLCAPSSSNQHDKSSYGEANLKVVKRNSGKDLSDLILKKLFRKLHRKQKMLPVTPRLLRTFSIHHLECNDYVLPEERTNESEIKVLKSEEADSFQSSKQVPPSAEGEKCDVCESVNITKHAGQNQLVEPGGHLTEKQAVLLEKLHATQEAREALTDATHVNRKDNHWISMDGWLHKIPYGQKVPEDVLTKMLFRSASARSYRDISNHNIKIPPKVHPHQSMQRSRSLTESLDQYSSLLNSISVRESKRLPESLNSAKKYSGLQDRKTPLERIYSNPEFRSYHLSRDTQGGIFDPSFSLKESSITPLDVDETADMHGFAASKLVETPLNMKDKMESDESIEQICNRDSSKTTDGLPLVKFNELAQSESCKVTDSTEEHGSHMQLPQQDTGALKCSFLGGEIHGIEVPEFSVSEQEGNSHIAEPTKEDPNSVLESCSEEDIVNPLKYAVSEDSELSSLHFEELNSLPKPVNLLYVDVSAVVEAVESSSSNEQPDGLTNSDAFNIKVDQKDEAEFNYVRNVLAKSGFSGSEFVGSWYSHSQLLDPLLFGKVNLTFDELEATTCGSNDTSLDHQLLSALINEVLFEIYEKSFARTWFLRIHPCARPIPVGHHVLEEVWGKISCYLSSQRQPNHSRESVLARDFAKSDGWLNLQWDAESVGMELECLILDDLFDECLPVLIDT